MNKRKIKPVSEEQKMTIQLWLGVLLVLFGVAMLIASFIVPPLGIIHSSVLAAIGEVFTFAGALIGLDYTYRYKRLKFEDERVKEEDRRQRYEGASDDIADN